MFGPESFAARCSLRLDFALRHLPRRRLAAPVTVVPSFVFSVFNSHHNSGAAVIRSFRPLCFNSGGTPKFRERRSPKRDRQKRVLWQFQLRAGFLAIGRPSQMHGEGLLRLHRKIDLLVRRTQSNQVLRIECAEGCCDGWPDAYDAFLYSGPKQCNPKIAAKEQLRAAHRGRAPGMGGAINLHLLDRRPCIVHEAAPMRGVTVFVHPRLQRASGRDWM